jgi:hypothetical protein
LCHGTAYVMGSENPMAIIMRCWAALLFLDFSRAAVIKASPFCADSNVRPPPLPEISRTLAEPGREWDSCGTLGSVERLPCSCALFRVVIALFSARAVVRPGATGALSGH